MVIELYFKNLNTMLFLEVTKRLPLALQPLYYSADEEKINKKNKCSNHDKLERFANDNPLGFFLYFDGGYINISINKKGKDSIFIQLPNTFEVDAIEPTIEKLIVLKPYYAYAAQWEERVFRNCLFKDCNGMTVEKFLGKACELYLPGVYWGNLVSDKMAFELKLNVDEIFSGFHRQRKIGGKFHWVEMYEQPKSWESNADRLDLLCFDNKNVFSLDKIFDELNDISDWQELISYAKSWP